MLVTVWIAFANGIRVEHRFRVDAIPFVVGRGAPDLPLPDKQVSRRHFELFSADGTELSLLDAGSLNGIRVNGVELRHKVLAQGDEIEVGETRILILELVARDEERTVIGPMPVHRLTTGDELEIPRAA